MLSSYCSSEDSCNLRWIPARRSLLGEFPPCRKYEWCSNKQDFRISAIISFARSVRSMKKNRVKNNRQSTDVDTPCEDIPHILKIVKYMPKAKKTEADPDGKVSSLVTFKGSYHWYVFRVKKMMQTWLSKCYMFKWKSCTIKFLSCKCPI